MGGRGRKRGQKRGRTRGRGIYAFPSSSPSPHVDNPATISVMPDAEGLVLSLVVLWAANVSWTRPALRSRTVTRRVVDDVYGYLLKAFVPQGVRQIGSEAFRGHRRLGEVWFPDGLVTIRICAFEGCLSLKKVTLPSSLRRIERNAFGWCGLETVTFAWGRLGQNLKTIDDRAFIECPVAEIKLPHSVEWIGTAAFRKCHNLTVFELPYGITLLPREMVADCTTLRRIVIPNSVREIGECAFSGCKNLRDVQIGNASCLTRIGACAFRGTAIRGVPNLPPGVEFGHGVFARCQWLTSARLPPTHDVPKDLFLDCQWLLVAVLENCTAVLPFAFSNCPRLSVVLAPRGVELGNPGLGVLGRAIVNCPRLGEPTPLSPAGLFEASLYEHWSPLTHRLIRPEQQEWIRFVLTLFSQRLRLPSVCAQAIATALKISEI